MVNSSNRLRLPQIAARFAAQGFEVLQVREDFKVPVSKSLRQGFVVPFASMPLADLEILTGMIQVRRVA